MRPLAALLLVALLGLTGCGSDDPSTAWRHGPDPVLEPSSSASADAKQIGRYVALGDSYTAAPYVYLTDVAQGCLRSNGNYPALLAKKLDVAQHVDVSCSGATSKDLTGRQNTFRQQTVPPQLAAVTRDTDLVTLGIGGNDFGLFGSLVGTCPISGPQGGFFAVPKGVRCGQVDLRTATTAVRRIGRLIRTNLAAIHRGRRMRPWCWSAIRGSCRRRGPARRRCRSSAADTIPLDVVTRALSQQMKSAAERTHSVFVDLYAASERPRRLCRQAGLGQRRAHRHQPGRGAASVRRRSSARLRT